MTDHAAAKAQWRLVADQMRGKLPKLATLMDTAEEVVLAYLTFPAQHCTKLHSANPIERLGRHRGYPLKGDREGDRQPQRGFAQQGHARCKPACLEMIFACCPIPARAGRHRDFSGAG